VSIIYDFIVSHTSCIFFNSNSLTISQSARCRVCYNLDILICICFCYRTDYFGVVLSIFQTYFCFKVSLHCSVFEWFNFVYLISCICKYGPFLFLYSRMIVIFPHFSCRVICSLFYPLFSVSVIVKLFKIHSIIQG
jgi:hypothetical protein